MKFGNAIIYVKNVEETVNFYVKAFGCTLAFMTEDKLYAQLETGETALGFANEKFMRDSGLDFVSNDRSKLPAGFEIAFAAQDVEKAFNDAVAAGALPVQKPIAKPWGQTISHVRDNNGILIEICSPMEL